MATEGQFSRCATQLSVQDPPISRSNSTVCDNLVRTSRAVRTATYSDTCCQIGRTALSSWLAAFAPTTELARPCTSRDVRVSAPDVIALCYFAKRRLPLNTHRSPKCAFLPSRRKRPSRRRLALTELGARRLGEVVHERGARFSPRPHHLCLSVARRQRKADLPSHAGRWNSAPHLHGVGLDQISPLQNRIATPCCSARPMRYRRPPGAAPALEMP